MSYSSIYYDPEDFGLETVLVIDIGLSYEFDMFVVWRDTDGRLYSATDSGCSCPSPFESLTLADLKKCECTVSELHKELDAWADGRSGWGALDPGDMADAHLTIANLRPAQAAA